MFKSKFACELKNFDPSEFFDRKELRKYDPFSQYALVSVDQAIIDSKLDLEYINKDRVGVIWGSGNGGIQTFQDQMMEFCNGDGTPRFTPFFIPRILVDIAAGLISIKYGFRGVNFCPVSACATSSTAIIEAFNYIKWNKADLFVTGGSEACIFPPGIGGFNAMMALSTRNKEPKTASRPFDKNRDGFVMGEGGGALVLEEYEHAINRGANIYAELVGSGLTADAHHITAPHPEGIGAQNVMNQAIKEAGIEKTSVDYINVHGTSTPLGDIAEIKAIKTLFGNHAYKLNISSTKSMTGHLLGAAGVVEAIACIMSVKDDVVPPTINHETYDPDIDKKLDLTLNKSKKRKVNYALSNTFGFGGHNASLLVKKYQR